MALSFKFSVVQASPDRRRGERVNVGVLVFLNDRVDFRVPELRKLKMLAGHGWDEIASAYGAQVATEFAREKNPDQLIKNISTMSKIFMPSDLGSAIVNTTDEYEDRVNSILNTLVVRPSLTKGEKQARINSEISKMLTAQQVLATKGQTIDDHKVVRGFVVSKDKELVADFAYRNGTLRVVATLEMRGTTAAHGKACEKGATLHFAREVFGSNTSTLAVYAVSPLDIKARSAEIDILKGFSNGNAFNWLDPSEQRTFRHLLY
jgi:hypothetical protein